MQVKLSLRLGRDALNHGFGARVGGWDWSGQLGFLGATCSGRQHAAGDKRSSAQHLRLPVSIWGDCTASSDLRLWGTEETTRSGGAGSADRTHRKWAKTDAASESLRSTCAIGVEREGRREGLPRCQGLASSTMLVGVSVARRTRVKPPCRSTSVSRFSPAWAPRAKPTS